MVTALLGVVLLVAGAAGLVLLDVLIRRPDVAATMLFSTAVVQALFVDKVPALQLSGTHVYVTDLVAVSITAAALARVLRLKRFDRFQRWLLLLAVLLGVSLLQGVAAFGMQTAVNDFRQYLFFVGSALYFSTFAPSSGLSARIGRIWLVMTVPMMLLAGLRWVQNFAGLQLGVPASKWGADAAIRVLDGPYVFFLAQAFVLTIPAWLHGQPSRRQRVLSIVLLLMVIALNRRTAWLAVGAGIAVLLLRDRRLGRRAMVLVTLGTSLGVLGFVALGGLQEGAQQPVTQEDAGNFTWRVEGWLDLLGPWLHNPLSWVVGEPFGSSFAREINGIEVTTNPHDFYIQTMMRAGVPGLIALLVLTVGVGRVLWRTPAPAAGLLDAGMMPALLAMQVVWYLTWIPGSEQGVVTGLALAMAAMPLADRRSDPTLAPERAGPGTLPAPEPIGRP
ncbi:O-antigen ligase family protein [Pseudonocardia charpentierae]|uniref:O-antigen ligase family protein n=1 Tax=Pseudonocardia charpentierae TaxID=3075545 RepID=A0ABU2NKN3_9PSEU|nr:O-antigen ligase family protein [Pseudonocardia sp. DSM 45834]MDT0353774.1 O-antigen ligase family protein [Pseudonocardia sp. DSM 45834]